MLDPFHSGKRTTAPRFGALSLNPDLLIIGITKYKMATSITHRDCVQTQKDHFGGYFPPDFTPFAYRAAPWIVRND
jgi:hypothetical protein